MNDADEIELPPAIMSASAPEAHWRLRIATDTVESGWWSTYHETRVDAENEARFADPRLIDIRLYRRISRTRRRRWSEVDRLRRPPFNAP